ncbi:MAG TPA: hypothetical protein VJV78_05675 [Polyangiales bacterium]|nr:hypothetical protein [Polyangiales bacterium]
MTARELYQQISQRALSHQRRWISTLKVLPELFETNRSLALATVPKQVHHLAVDTHMLGRRRRAREGRDHASNLALEELSVGFAAAHELG